MKTAEEWQSDMWHFFDGLTFEKHEIVHLIRQIQQDALRNEGDDQVDVRDYLQRRRQTIESSIASEVLAGNEWKEKCERTALAEITALEVWLANIPHAINQNKKEGGV